MKLIIDIYEEIYKHVDTIQNGSIGAKQIINSVKNGIPAYKAISSVDPYKGMTNGEVIKAVFPNGKVLNKDECIGFEIIFDDGTSYCSFYDGIWWNSPYEPQESEDKE